MAREPGGEPVSRRSVRVERPGWDGIPWQMRWEAAQRLSAQAMRLRPDSPEQAMLFDAAERALGSVTR